MNPNKNWMCDNNKCKDKDGEVRVLPTSRNPDHGNMLLCYDCYRYEIDYRRQRNMALCKEEQCDLPNWDALKIYNPKE